MKDQKESMPVDILMETRMEQSDDVDVEFNQDIYDGALRLLEHRVLLMNVKALLSGVMAPPEPPTNADDRSMRKEYLRDISYSQTE